MVSSTIRAGDRDREQVAERLRQAAIGGYLGAEELEERIATALTARTSAELEAVLADLPSVLIGQSTSPKPPALARPRGTFARRAGAQLIDGMAQVLAIMILGGLFNKPGAALAMLLGIAYSIYFVGRSGQTLGKRVLGLRVVDLPSGGPIGYRRALARYVGKIICGLSLGLGFLWMLGDKESQAWDDKLAASAVIPDYLTSSLRQAPRLAP